MSAAPSLSNIQRELLKVYSQEVSDDDLLNIKRYLAKYFASKAINEADEIWDKKGYNDETMRKWQNEDDKGSH